LLNGVHAFKNPEYNWDMLPYMAVINNYQHKDAGVHDTIFNMAKMEMPVSAYKKNTDSNNVYRWKAAQDKEFFQAQLEFYQVKPLYTGTAFLFYKTGFSLMKATVLPSIVFYFLLGILLLIWLRRYLKIEYAVICGLLLMFSAPLMQAARLSTPDCMAALFVLAAFYFFKEKQSLAICYLFLLLAILTRIDNILPCVFILCALIYFDKKNKSNWAKYILMVAGACFCFFLAPLLFSSHALRLSSFFDHLKPFNDTTTGFHWTNYVRLVKSQLANGFYYSSLLIFLFVCSMIFIHTGIKFQEPGSDQSLIVIIVSTIACRFLLQPVISDRFYIPYYLCIAILLARRIALKIYP
jgi:4-amino-4-deoxy-L-arabinose transferase-like glycosyltransferase